MHFTPDTDLNLEFAVGLCNTVAGATKSGEDELSTTGELDAIVTRVGFSGRLDHDAAELAEVRAARSRVRAVWAMERADAVAEVNAMLREATALPQLVLHDAFDWHIHGTTDDAPLAERMLVEVAMALVDVIRSDEMHRLRACAAPDCEGVLVDLSRNGSKQYCSIRCGNRMNQIAHRERSAA